MTILDRLESFIESLEREAYEVGAGLKEEANFSAIFDRMGDLISSATVAELRDAELDSTERAEYLSFLLCMIIDKTIKTQTDAVITKELEAAVETAGGRVSFRQLPVMIANEPSHEARAELDALRRGVQLELNPILEDITEITHLAALDFGYAGYADFFEKIEGISLGDLNEQADKLLDATLPRYRAELEHYCDTFLNIPMRELAQFDLAYMRRASLFDHIFPAGKLLPAAWETMDNMGIQAKNHPHVRLDIETRERKSPRAFCCPVRVPDEVYLVIMPHGGVDDYSSFLHELGHTLHYAHTAAGLPLASRRLGDNSVTEAHAGLLEHLIISREWLRARLGADSVSEYLRFMNFFELYMLRRYCAKLRYETALHGGARVLSDCARLYADVLSEATLVKYDPAFYLQDVDSHFYCARYLRSWMLERQMRAALESRFGTEWFDDPAAGKLLIQLWSQGQKYKAESVSAALGFDSLNFDAIIAEYVN